MGQALKVYKVMLPQVGLNQNTAIKGLFILASEF